MQLRPATPDDFAALAELQRRWTTTWFGAPEQSADEVIEQLARIDPLDEDSLLCCDGDRIVGAGVRWSFDTDSVVDPDLDPEPVYAALLPWFAAREPRHVDVLSRDERVLAILAAAGWTHRHSAFELFTEVDPHAHPDAPNWPDGIDLLDFSPSLAPELYQLIYRDAGWTKVTGHPPREFDDWRELFLSHTAVPELQVLACRDERLVGVSLGRIWDDGTGWVSQLAVAETERGRGLGRALLRESLDRYVRGGAKQLGLSVQAGNRGALRMYLDAGLQVDREWMRYAPA